MPTLRMRDGWLSGVRRVPSPHQDARPDRVTPDLLVVHGISLPPGEFGGPWIEALFSGRLDTSAHPYFAGLRDLKVSAHVLVRRDGGLVQFVPFDRRAWHAGESSHAGRARCNDYSIGIELEGTDDRPYTRRQYRQLAALARLLMRRLPGLERARIVGHSDIAPGRKTDPGPAFRWRRLRRLLDGRLR